MMNPPESYTVNKEKRRRTVTFEVREDLSNGDNLEFDRYDGVAEDPTKSLACEETLSKEPTFSRIEGARIDLQMIGKSTPSTSAPGDKPHACDVCDYRPARARDLKSHMATHTGEKPHSCDVCDFRTAWAFSLKIHSATHTDNKRYACDVCDFRTAWAVSLKRHMTTHTGEKSLACDVCDFRTEEASTLKSHMTTHTGEKPHACDVCDYRALRASDLKRHLTTHAGEKSHACDVCDFRTAWASSLKVHKATHTGDKPHACDVCDYRAARAWDLKSHMAAHTGEIPHSCDVCDFRTAWAFSLKIHTATHTGDKPHACDVCDFRAARAGDLKSHMATHTGEKPHSCDVCDFRTAWAFSLKIHSATHTDNKRYACDVCDFRTAWAVSLKRHMTTHTGEKSLACDVCDFRTAWAFSLKSHMATHTGEKPHACDVCDYRALRASDLKRHLTTHAVAELRVKEGRPDDAEINAIAVKMMEQNKEKRAAAAVQAAVVAAETPAQQSRGEEQQSMLNYLRGSGQGQITANGDDEKPPLDITSQEGKFGWVTLGGEHIPYIVRAGEKYCSVRIFEQKLLSKYRSYPSSDIVSCTYIRSYYITEIEAKLFTEINMERCEGMFGKEPFTDKDLVVLLGDADEFYMFLELCYKKLLHPQSDVNNDRCGFVRINKDSVVPYTVKDNCRYVPLFYFEGETDALKKYSTNLGPWDLAYLKFCCKVLGIRSEFFANDTCQVISLPDIRSFFPAGTVFDEYWPPKVVDSPLVAKNSVQHNQTSWINALPTPPPPGGVSISRTPVLPADQAVPPLAPANQINGWQNMMNRYPHTATAVANSNNNRLSQQNARLQQAQMQHQVRYGEELRQ